LTLTVDSAASSSSTHVVLAHGDPPIAIAADRVYFAFPNGRLTYDCGACGGRCCRGQGFQVVAERDVPRQLAKRYALRFFLDPPESGRLNHFNARNLQPACFFLDGQNRCSLHVEDGYEAKPSTCRLFPFVDLTRVADVLVVAPHIGLCPLSVLPAGETSDASSHEQLLALLTADGITGHVPVADIDEGGARALIALERQIVQLCEGNHTASQYAANVAEQLALAQLMANCERPPDRVRAGARDDVERFVRTLHDVLGVDGRSEDGRHQALLQTMIGMTPAIRSHLLFGQGAPEPDAVERIPRFLLALHTLAGLAGEAGMTEITYQTVMGLFGSYRSFLGLLSNLDRVMVWKPDAEVEFAVSRDPALQSRYLAVAKALMPARQREASATLGAILAEHAAADGLERVVLLKLLAKRFAGRLVPLSASSTAADAPQQPRAAAQQLAMEHLSIDRLMGVTDRGKTHRKN
jgi:hypothetical protein